jgi:hypothetical protein
MLTMRENVMMKMALMTIKSRRTLHLSISKSNWTCKITRMRKKNRNYLKKVALKSQ